MNKIECINLSKSFFVDNNKIDLLKMGYFYFKFYSNEIYKQAANNPSLYFIVDVLTTELKKISILISEKNWDLELQEHLLKEILQNSVRF